MLTNDTGSNFVRGAITATVEHASWSGRLPYDIAVFELDEAWAVRFVERVAPRRALLLNVMRDQLDRFGEIDTTAALLGKVAAATTGHVVLNRDDERVAALAARTSAEVSYYGVAPDLRESFPTDEELYGGPVHVAATSRPRASCCACRRAPSRSCSCASATSSTTSCSAPRDRTTRRTQRARPRSR